MILVDIGNSGVRAVPFDQKKDSESLNLDRVFRLSWPANLHVRNKKSPQQKTMANQRWCLSDEDEAFTWLVDRIQASAEDRWIVSSVHQGALERLQAAVNEAIPSACFISVRNHHIPMTLQVDEPTKVGIDRLLAAWEGWHVANINFSGDARKPVIVAQAGTALTVDIVSEDKIFAGGAILPGLGLSLQLLAAGTDQLPWLGNHTVTSSPKLPGKNTLDAIAAGVHASLAGGARFLVDRYKGQNGWEGAVVVVTGGDGELLEQVLPAPTIYREHLVLRGLARLAISNSKGMQC